MMIGTTEESRKRQEILRSLPLVRDLTLNDVSFFPIYRDFRVNAHFKGITDFNG